MQLLIERILSKSRKRWFGSRPLFTPFWAVDSSELQRIEERVGAPLPTDFKIWLLAVGYGHIDEVLCFSPDWFHAIKQGHLKGAVIFAQDDLGNFYAYSFNTDNIYFFARSSHEYALIAPDFRTFLEELERRDFNLGEWMNGLSLLPYDWDS